ncbi:MAG: glycosyltransferase [Terracidiphilus sp.]
MNQRQPHITVCVCTYNRPELLKRLLTEVSQQETDGRFTFSAVVADNDPGRSGEATVDEILRTTPLLVNYCVEPTPGIAPTRNRAIANAIGDYVAFIDDDEFPIRRWLLILFEACIAYKVDGVFGPVKRYFDEKPPAWLQKSRFYDRRVNPTGMHVEWNEARTGNVLIKRDVLFADSVPFRTEFRVGEDQDFFRRRMEAGCVFVWCAEAEAFEVIPPERWKRIYMMKKGLLRGASAALQPSCTAVSILKSALAVPLYAVLLPFVFLLGQHRFMTLLVKLCDHLGKLSAVLGFNLIKEAYVAEKPA